MTITDPGRVSQRRLGYLLWMAGMIGVTLITATVLPQLLGNVALPAPLWVLSVASFVQSALLVALAVWAGVLLAPRVGLHAPAFEAAVTGRSIRQALRPQLLPGLVAGVVGGAGLFAIGGYAGSAALAEVQQRFAVPILARVFYGGITEELLLRWGLMTTLLWLMWRFLHHRRSPPLAGHVWFSIIASAILFGAGHLPAAAILIGQLTISIVVFVVAANAAFGVLFGYLFWKHGLEAAMIAHAVAHISSYLVGQL